MLKFACTNKEISCIIGNLFMEIESPCKECLKDDQEFITIKGRTYKDTTQTIKMAKDFYLYSGPSEDILEIKKRRCLIK